MSNTIFSSIDLVLISGHLVSVNIDKLVFHCSFNFFTLLIISEK
ncbi:MAG: hypothetical protein Q8S84_04405 [bacterium]|nr:hypothetical protein [bacterium]